jgi:hypothetical protein
MDAPRTDHSPAVIDRYQAAHDLHDTPAALATFAPEAVVLDDGHTYAGHEQIHRWLEGASKEYTFTRTLLGTEQLDADRWVVRNRIEGNFPGGVVDLAYRFTIEDDQIVHLEIAP